MTCVICGKQFLIWPSDLKFRNVQFCSKPCKGKWMSQYVRGENHPNWNGGPTEYPKGWGIALKRAIRERDGHACVNCGRQESTGPLSVHHINYNKNDLRPQNLATLCRPCHAKSTIKRDHWNELLTGAMYAEMAYR